MFILVKKNASFEFFRPDEIIGKHSMIRRFTVRYFLANKFPFLFCAIIVGLIYNESRNCDILLERKLSSIPEIPIIIKINDLEKRGVVCIKILKGSTACM